MIVGELVLMRSIFATQSIFVLLHVLQPSPRVTKQPTLVQFSTQTVFFDITDIKVDIIKNVYPTNVSSRPTPYKRLEAYFHSASLAAT